MRIGIVLLFCFLFAHETKGDPLNHLCKLQGTRMPLKLYIQMPDFTNPQSFGWTEEQTRNVVLEAARVWTTEFFNRLCLLESTSGM